MQAVYTMPVVVTLATTCVPLYI